MAKKATSIRLPEVLKQQAIDAGINISQLTERALLEELEYFNSSLPYSQESYIAALNVCKEFGLANHTKLIQSFAICIDKECEKTLNEHIK